MKKIPLKEYLECEYTIVLSKGEDGYEAWHPEFGKWTACGIGDTKQEALEELDSLRSTVIECMFEDGLKIPDSYVNEKEYSGQFVVRLPKSLHKALVEHANLENISLNQYIVHLLSQANTNSLKMDKIIQQNERILEQQEYMMNYGIPNQGTGQVQTGHISIGRS